MSVLYAPRNHSDRQQICRMIDDWQGSATDAQRLSLFEHHFKSAMARYQALYADYHQKHTAEKNTLLGLNEAETANDAAARNWIATVRDETGRERTLEIKALLGGNLMSAVLRKNMSFKVNMLGKLFDQLEIRRELRGDEIQLTQFRQKFEAFRAEVAREEREKNDLTAIGSQYTEATRQFDRAYNKFRQAWKLTYGDNDHNAFFPEFVSNKKDEKKEEKKEEKKVVAKARADFAAAKAEEKAAKKAARDDDASKEDEDE